MRTERGGRVKKGRRGRSEKKEETAPKKEKRKEIVSEVPTKK